MRVLYCSNTMSEAQFKEIFRQSKIKPNVVGNRFNNMIIDGFKLNGCNVTAISGTLMNQQINKKIFWKSEEELLETVNFKYVSFINIKILRQITNLIGFLKEGRAWAKNSKNESFIMTDSLNITASIAGVIISKIYKIPSITIITDFPEFLGANKLMCNLYNFLIKKYDKYVLLTAAMADRLEVNKEDYIIIEGFADEKMRDIPNNINDKLNPKVILYAGALHEKYGVKNLVDAFSHIEIEDVELRIFGQGDSEIYIKEQSKKDKRIKYFGVVENSEIIKQEIQATLLVNPRPSNEEFTKYSFPSKNMEYMSTGTAVVTTKLKGMPIEYYDKVFFFEEEGSADIARTLNKIVLLDIKSLHERGLQGKKFVLTKKNNKLQVEKIMKLIR
ncbi:MAG: glycosyltransferase [Sarcina sp.]